MSATQTITTTTKTVRFKKPKSNTKAIGNAVAKAYSGQLKAQKKKVVNSQRRCPTCGRPL